MLRLRLWMAALAALALLLAPVPARAGADLVALINAARAAAGVAPVTLDPVLTAAAEAKARDMIAHGYFGHRSPVYGTPGQLVRRFGSRYSAVAENLAGGTDAALAHARFMDSPAHRRNILAPQYRQVGVAVVPGGPYGGMIVELFGG